MTTAATPITDDALLQLIWLASPALPVGGFSYSEGLESAVDHGLVRDEATAADWIADHLHLVLSRSDLPVIAQAIEDWRARDLARMEQLNSWVLQTRESAEMRQQTEQMGRSFIEWLRSVRPQQVEGIPSPLAYPIACALAVSVLPGPPRQSLLALAFGWAENMMQAAIKAVPLGQSSGQRILARLAAEIPQAVDHALGLREDERQAFAPRLAILSSQHEIQYSRLFRS